MKIAIIGARGIDMEYSGIEKNLREICPRLVQRGHQVDVFSQPDPNGKDTYEGVNIIRVPSFSGKHSETLSRCIVALLQCVGKKYDIINIQAEGPGILSFLPRWVGSKCVVTIHGLDWQRAKWSRFARMSIKAGEKMALTCADSVTVVSKSLKMYFAEKYRKETQYIPNGIALKQKNNNADLLGSLGLLPREYVLFANRLVPEKGCHDLIQAFNRIDTGKKLVIAGGARYQEAYYQDICKMADPEKVIFTGHVSGDLLEQLFRNSYLVVLPSYIEGLANSLLEALGYHKCALVSDIPENLEVIEEVGYSFRKGNVDDLQACLIDLLENEDRVIQVENRLVDFVKQKYSWDQVVDQYEQVYRSII
jgi:glycosyltransferase involved in cell wall biosynthesis